MSTRPPDDDPPPARPGATEATPGAPDRSEDRGASPGSTPGTRRNPWIWVSALLALVAVGVGIWGLSTKSDLDSTQQQLDSSEEQLAGTQTELESAQQQLDSTTQDVEELQSAQAEQDTKAERRTALTVGAFATVKALYDDMAEQLGATQEDLAATDRDLDEATEKAAQAEQDAATAEQKAAEADNETDEAKAEAEQAKAEAETTQFKAAVAADCAKAYISAFGTLFEGESARAQAPVVRDKFATITADCKSARAGG